MHSIVMFPGESIFTTRRRRKWKSNRRFGFLRWKRGLIIGIQDQWSLRGAHSKDRFRSRSRCPRPFRRYTQKPKEGQEEAGEGEEKKDLLVDAEWTSASLVSVLG